MELSYVQPIRGRVNNRNVEVLLNQLSFSFEASTSVSIVSYPEDPFFQIDSYASPGDTLGVF